MITFANTFILLGLVLSQFFSQLFFPLGHSAHQVSELSKELEPDSSSKFRSPLSISLPGNGQYEQLNFLGAQLLMPFPESQL